MRINILSPGFYKSGGLLTIYDYSNRFVENGHEVTLYIPKKIYNLQVDKFQPIDKLRRIVHRFRIDREKYLLELKKYKFDIKIVPSLKNRYIDDADITVATAWPTAFDLNSYETSKGKKVYFVQDYEVWDSNIKYVDMSYKLPVNKIVISKYLQDLLRNKFNTDSEIVLTSINFQLFNNEQKIFNENSVLLFVYSEANRKNIKMIMQSMEYIHEKYPNVVIKSFGFEKKEIIPVYIEYSENPSLEDRIKLYCNSDIFLLSSNFEGFGIPPAEAMACRCAVVSTDVGAISEYSENNVSSLIVPSGNLDKFIKAIEYLINNKKEIERISIAGYNNVREKLNYEESVKKFENLLVKWSNDKL